MHFTGGGERNKGVFSGLGKQGPPKSVEEKLERRQGGGP